MNAKHALAVLAATASLTAQAAPTTYIGADDAVSSLAQMTNSQAAAAAFSAAVGSPTVVDFESALPAFLTISGGSTTSSSCGAVCGFNTTAGGAFFRLLGGGSATFNFATPVDAFGFYITGLQTDIVIGQLLTYTDGSTTEIIPTPSAIRGGGAFMGFTDFGKSVTSVTYIAQAPAVGDVVAIDDLLFRATRVPEPGSLALLGLGLAGLGLSRRRTA